MIPSPNWCWCSCIASVYFHQTLFIQFHSDLWLNQLINHFRSTSFFLSPCLRWPNGKWTSVGVSGMRSVRSRARSARRVASRKGWTSLAGLMNPKPGKTRRQSRSQCQWIWRQLLHFRPKIHLPPLLLHLRPPVHLLPPLLHLRPPVHLLPLLLRLRPPVHFRPLLHRLRRWSQSMGFRCPKSFLMTSWLQLQTSSEETSSLDSLNVFCCFQRPSLEVSVSFTWHAARFWRSATTYPKPGLSRVLSTCAADLFCFTARKNGPAGRVSGRTLLHLMVVLWYAFLSPLGSSYMLVSRSNRWHFYQSSNNFMEWLLVFTTNPHECIFAA